MSFLFSSSKTPLNSVAAAVNANNSSFFANNGTSNAASSPSKPSASINNDDEAFPTLPTPNSDKSPDRPELVKQSATSSSSKVSRVYDLPLVQQKQAALKKMPLADYCSEAARTHHVTIDASTSTTSRKITVVFGGKVADILAAKKWLWSRIAEKAVRVVAVPPESLRYVIGSSGKTLQTIHESVGNSVHIEIPARDAPYDGHIRIVGDADAIETAKRMIEQIVYERRARAQSTVQVAARLLPFLFSFDWSMNGQAAKMSERFGCKVTVLSLSEQCNVVLVGDQDCLERARLEILDQSASVNPISVQLAVPKARHRYLIGTKASTLHAIQTEQRCIIDVPVQESDSEIITISALAEDLPDALRAVLNITASFVTRIITCSEAARHFLLHRHKAAIREVEAKAEVALIGVKDGFEVEGRKERVDRAIALFGEKIRPLISSLHSLTVPVHRGYVKHIIGKQGQHIAQLNSEYGVEVIIDEPASPSPSLAASFVLVWLVSPDQAMLGRAKESIDRLIDELEERTGNVNVPTISPTLSFAINTKHHLMLQGPQGRNLKHLDAKYGVRVVFPRDPQESSDVLVYGPDQKAKQAKDELLELLSEELKRNHEETLSVPTKILPLLIGKGGATIQSLRAAHDVQIEVIDPSKGSAKQDAQVVLKGLESNCKAVSEYIRSILPDQSDILLDDAQVHFLAHRWGNEFMSWKDSECPGARLLLNEKKLIRVGQKAFKKYMNGLSDHWTARIIGCPSTLFGSVIGAGGAVRRRISEQSGVDVWVPPSSTEVVSVAAADGKMSYELVSALTFDPEKDLQCIQVTGPKEASVKNAAEAIILLVRDRPASQSAPRAPPIRAEHSLTVSVPCSLHRIVIGKKGDTIQRLRTAYSCLITVPPATTSDDITLSGADSGKLEACATAIRELVEGKH